MQVTIVTRDGHEYVLTPELRAMIAANMEYVVRVPNPLDVAEIRIDVLPPHATIAVEAL